MPWGRVRVGEGQGGQEEGGVSTKRCWYKLRKRPDPLFLLQGTRRAIAAAAAAAAARNQPTKHANARNIKNDTQMHATSRRKKNITVQFPPFFFLSPCTAPASSLTKHHHLVLVCVCVCVCTAYTTPPHHHYPGYALTLLPHHSSPLITTHHHSSSLITHSSPANCTTPNLIS